MSGGHICRADQNRTYTPYMTVYLAISLPKILDMHRLYTILANPNHYTVPCGLNALAVQIGISDIDVTSYNMYLWQAPLDVDTWDVNDKCVCMCACVHVCNATCPWHFLSVLACPSLAWHVPGGLK